MDFDFSKIQGSNGNESSARNPKEIFKVLPRKNRKYAYLRDVQAEVLDTWFNHREQTEVVVKMNTGSGKTVVSLLILQCCIDDQKGPAVYVVPDKYLLEQVKTEAAQLGITVTEDPRDLSYSQGSAILLITINKLFNARSVFGVGDDGIKIPIGTLLIDDAHACIDRIEEQFTVSVKQGDSRYALLFDLFKEALRQQSQSKTDDINSGANNTRLQVPFWSVQANSQNILRILSADIQNGEEMYWKLGLVKEFIIFADCVVSTSKIEFSFRVIPTSVIPNYDRARKIIVSATLPDDTVLQSTLNISKEAIKNPITPSDASDLGERLIIVPQAINPEITKDEVRNLVVEYSKSFKVFVIVPSRYRAIYWHNVAEAVLTAENIQEELQKLQCVANGLVVLVNKYDGIDLPDDACRVLVIDELPADSSEIEKIDANVLRSNHYSILRKVRKVEQGMGRAIRSNEDYCAVILLGRSLASYLFTSSSNEGFTPATRRQFEVSINLLNQIRGGTITEIRSAVNLVLERNVDWISSIKSVLVGLSFSPEIPNEIAFYFRDAYEAAWIRQYAQARDIMQDCVNKYRDRDLQGWIKYYLALFANFVDPALAQNILVSGISLNSQIVKPLDGVRYQRHPSVADQAAKAREYLSRYSSDPNKFIVDLNAILDHLVFRPDTSEQFESAIMDVGQLLGFGSQRPEDDCGRGPDNLWTCGGLRFFVIECKNGCTAELINKHDTNQMNGSIIWFEEEFDSSCIYTPIMFHLRTRFQYAASPNPRIRIVDNETLDLFKTALKQYATSVLQSGQIAELDTIRRLIQDNGLTPELIAERFTKPALS